MRQGERGGDEDSLPSFLLSLVSLLSFQTANNNDGRPCAPLGQYSTGVGWYVLGKLVQGDTSGCSLGSVDIKAKVPF